MADDIVVRLRHAAEICTHGLPDHVLRSTDDPTSCGRCLRLIDAADEIEVLRAERHHWEHEAKRWERKCWEARRG